jgi:hypothetical protein
LELKRQAREEDAWLGLIIAQCARRFALDLLKSLEASG